MKTKIAILIILLLSGCTRPEKARELLDANGYKDIEITGYNWFSCRYGIQSDRADREKA